jgi:crotonobetainyl-CoA:carnitine CoA-transferase CaiB-like acyl-CoA transferase
MWNFNGIEQPRPEARSKALYPAGCYECGDGYVVFAASNDPFFTRLCEGIGQPGLQNDLRFATPEAKATHWDEFMGYLDPWLRARTRAEVFSELQSHGVMVAPMLSVAEAIEDPQARARESFVDVAAADAPPITIAGPPLRMEDAWSASPAPRLGADTHDVLREHGYSTDEQIALFRAGVT